MRPIRLLFVGLLALLLAFLGTAAVPVGCPDGVFKFNKRGCMNARNNGCPVTFVGKGCLNNCAAKPQGCNGKRRRKGDGK